MKLSIFAITSMLVASASAFVPQSRLSTGVAFVNKSPQTPGAVLSSTSLQMSKEMDYVKEQIDGNDVMIFSKSYCPFCESTKRLFENMDGVEFTVVELDQRDDGDDIRDALLEFSGQKTFPNVFVKGTHIGGNDETQLAAKMGKIKKILAE